MLPNAFGSPTRDDAFHKLRLGLMFLVFMTLMTSDDLMLYIYLSHHTSCAVVAGFLGFRVLVHVWRMCGTVAYLPSAVKGSLKLRPVFSVSSPAGRRFRFRVSLLVSSTVRIHRSIISPKQPTNVRIISGSLAFILFNVFNEGVPASNSSRYSPTRTNIKTSLGFPSRRFAGVHQRPFTGAVGLLHDDCSSHCCMYNFSSGLCSGSVSYESTDFLLSFATEAADHFGLD